MNSTRPDRQVFFKYEKYTNTHSYRIKRYSFITNVNETTSNCVLYSFIYNMLHSLSIKSIKKLFDECDCNLLGSVIRFGMAKTMIYMEIDMLLSKYRSVICSLNGVGWLQYGSSASMTNRFESCVDKWLKRVLERFSHMYSPLMSQFTFYSSQFTCLYKNTHTVRRNSLFQWKII